MARTVNLVMLKPHRLCLNGITCADHYPGDLIRVEPLLAGRLVEKKIAKEWKADVRKRKGIENTLKYKIKAEKEEPDAD